MADNVTANAGAGGETFATDDDGTAHHPYVKVEFGADNTQTKVTASTPLPTDWAGTDPPIGAGTEAAALRVTLATNSTGVISVDDNGGSITIDNAGLTELAVAINASSQMDVNIAASTATVTVDLGANNDVTLNANSGVDIGDVDVTSVVPGTGATNLGKAIDTASGGTDTGVASLAIRDDTLTALIPVDGDYVPLRVNSTGSLHVTGAGGGAQFNIDDVAGGTDTGTLSLVIRDDVLTTLTPADGDYVGLRVNSTGALHVTGAAGVTEFNEDAAASGGEAGNLALGVRRDADTSPVTTDGDFHTMVFNDTGALKVEIFDGGGSHTVDNNGTFVVQEDGAALTALQIIDNVVHVDDAAFTLGTDSGVMMMGFAGTQSVNANDAAALACETDGALHIHDGGNTITVDGTVTANLSATDNAVLDQIELNTSYGDNAGGGTESGSLRVTIANDSTGVVSIDDNGGTLTVDNAGLTELAAAINGSSQMDVNIAASAATVTVDLGANNDVTLNAGSNLVGDVGLSGARTSGGTTIFRSIDLDEGALEVVKASAGQLYWIHVMNLASATRFVKIYNATSGTYGTGTPVLTFPIATQGDTNGAGFTLSIPNGIAFATGISIGAGTGIADNDTGAPGANEVIVNLGFA